MSVAQRDTADDINRIDSPSKKNEIVRQRIDDVEARRGNSVCLREISTTGILILAFKIWAGPRFRFSGRT